MVPTTERNPIRILLALLLIVATSTIAVASPNKKFDFLLHFNDLNEAAFAYHRHCIGTGQTINPQFLETLDLVANDLFTEAKLSDPKANPVYIKDQILKRRYEIQYQLDREDMKNGCNSKTANMAKAHYEEFSRFDETAVRQFIQDRTSGK